MNAPTQSEEKTGGRDWMDLLSPTGDELDRLAVEEIGRLIRLGNHQVSALDCDCGRGGQALRMAQAGAFVLATDAEDQQPTIADAASTLGVGSRIRFLHTAALGDDTTPLPGAPFDLAICHRSLPAMRYPEALRFVRGVLMTVKIGGKIFLSAYGLHSELGDHYPDSEKRVRERFSELSPEVAGKYGIAGPVCLYSERDLFLLLFEAGASVLKTFTTTHGNVKAVAVRV